MYRNYISIATVAALLTCSLSAVELQPGAKEYKRRILNKNSAARAVGGATLGEIRNAPHEWGRGWSGFGKRLASAFGTHAVKTGIRVTVARIRHEELDYQRSGKEGFGPRLKHALVSTVVTRKTTTGAKTA